MEQASTSGAADLHRDGDSSSRPEERTERQRLRVPRRMRAGGSILETKIWIDGIRPEIWRRLLIPGRTSFADLHLILQAALGWKGRWSHHFAVWNTRIRSPHLRKGPYLLRRDEQRLAMRDIVGEGSQFYYFYGFEDLWIHHVTIEAAYAPDPGAPLCIAGQRACPPEACAGVEAYDDLLAILEDPAHPRYRKALDLADDAFNPEQFDIERANTAIAEALA